MQGVERTRIARLAIHSRHCVLKQIANLRRTCAQCGQPFLVNLLVTRPFRPFFRRAIRPARQVPEGGSQALQFQQVFVLRRHLLFKGFSSGSKNAGVLARIHRKTMLAVEDAEFALFLVEGQLQLSLVEHHAVLVGQHGQQNFALQFVFQRLPIDVEKI